MPGCFGGLCWLFSGIVVLHLIVVGLFFVCLYSCFRGIFVWDVKFLRKKW